VVLAADVIQVLANGARAVYEVGDIRR